MKNFNHMYIFVENKDDWYARVRACVTHQREKTFYLPKDC